MSRLAFAIIGQTAEEILSGLPCKIYDEVSEAFVASTNPNDGYPFTILNNNDSSYYVDGLPMSIYSVYAGSDQVPQSELQYKVFLNDEALVHFNDAMDEGPQVWHHKLDDTVADLAKLWSSKKISDELDSKADQSDFEATDAIVDAHVGADNPHTDSASDTDLAAHTDADNPHADSASATPGSGLVAEGGNKLAVKVDGSTVQIDPTSNEIKVNPTAFGAVIRVNSIYSNFSMAGAEDGDTPPVSKHLQTTSALYEKKFSMRYIKMPGDNIIKLDTLTTVVTGTDSQGKVKLKITHDGGYVESETGNIGVAGIRTEPWVDITALVEYSELTIEVYILRVSGIHPFAIYDQINIFSTPMNTSDGSLP